MKTAITDTIVRISFGCLKVLDLKTAITTTRVLNTCRLGKTFVEVSDLYRNFTMSVQKLSRGNSVGLIEPSPFGNTKYMIIAVDIPIIRYNPIRTHSSCDLKKKYTHAIAMKANQKK